MRPDKSALWGGKKINGMPWETDHSRNKSESKVMSDRKRGNFAEYSDSRSEENDRTKLFKRT